MKKITISLLIILTVPFLSFSQPGWRPGEMEIKVTLSSESISHHLSKLHLNGEVYNHYALLYVTPDEVQKLEKEGIPFEITKRDLNRCYEGFWENRDGYHSYYQIIALADSLADHFPGICQKFSFGYSVQDRQLLALKISDSAGVDQPEPEVMFDGGIHGDELLGPEIIIRFARDLCLAYGTDPRITQLIDTREIWLYLMVNPDGTVAVTRYNANGVDLNRDWGYMWDSWGGSPSSFSQIETRALRECMYTNQFVAHTTYHAGTEFLAYPWSYRSQSAPDDDPIYQLATIYVDSSLYPNLEYGQGFSGMYAINGSSKDSNYGIMGSVSWTMEISMEKQPPASQIALYYSRNKPAMLAVIEHAGYGIEGTVTDAVTGDPLPAIVLVDGLYQIYTDPGRGDFHKYLVPGTYSVRVIANGYEPQVIEDVIVNELDATIVDVALQPGGGYYVYKIGGCQIPGNNEADEGFTPAVFGAPDEVNYSIGKSGWIVLDMQQPVIDGPGTDFIVHEGDVSPEQFTCYCGPSLDGPWTMIAEGDGTTGFDLATVGIAETQFLKIVDDGDGTALTSNAGFDLDAIEVMVGIQGVYLSITNYILIDQNGNQNGKIDPGEVCDLHITVKNNGNEFAGNVYGSIQTLSPFLSLLYEAASFGDLAHGESAEGIFTLTCDPLTPEGYVWQTDLELQANNGGYISSYNLAFPVGEIAETWESGDFSSFEWEQTSSSHWTISDENPYEGLFCARSGAISDNQTSGLEISMEVSTAGSVSFFRKVSSEAGYDFLEFYIDNTLAEKWSGEVGWGEFSYPVSQGMHTFAWVYSKDAYISNGSDCGWIDFIVFPPCPIAGSVYQGTVTDCTSGSPIPFATLTFTNLETNESFGVQTEPTGTYSALLPVGSVQICAEHIDYETGCDTVTVYANETVGYDLCLYGAIGLSDPAGPVCRTYPNPFSSSVCFEITHQPDRNLCLIISDLYGREVNRITHLAPTGTVTTVYWDGTDRSGKKVRSGFYCYTLQSDSGTSTGKVFRLEK